MPPGRIGLTLYRSGGIARSTAHALALRRRRQRAQFRHCPSVVAPRFASMSGSWGEPARPATCLAGPSLTRLGSGVCTAAGRPGY